jgi:hypothetical protein
LYRKQTFVLDNGDCAGTQHYNYPNVLFEPQGSVNTPITTSVPSGAFGLTLFCAATSSGSGFDPNLSYGGRAAILSGEAGFDSCYSRVLYHQISGSIDYRSLMPGIRICMLGGDSELALVTLPSVSHTSYNVAGNVTVWQVLTGH